MSKFFPIVEEIRRELAESKLSYKQREREPKKDFVFPGKKTKKNPAGKGGYPIPDKSHARNALSRVSRFGTSSEKKAVKAKVHKKFPAIK
jgi:hypothetical protein